MIGWSGGVGWWSVEGGLGAGDAGVAAEYSVEEVAFGVREVAQLAVDLEHLLLLVAGLLLHRLVQPAQQRSVLLHQSPTRLSDCLPQGSELLAQVEFVHPEPRALALCGCDVVLEESEGGSEAVDCGEGLRVLLLLGVGEGEGGVEAGEAADDVGAREEGDALGVVVHDVLGEVGGRVAQPQLVQHALLARRPVLLLHRSQPVMFHQKIIFLPSHPSHTSSLLTHHENQSSRSLKKSVFLGRSRFFGPPISPSSSSSSFAFSFFLMPSMALRSSSSVLARLTWRSLVGCLGGSLIGMCCGSVMSSACSQMLNFSLGALLSSLFFLSGPSRSRFGASSLGAYGLTGYSLTAWAQGLFTGSFVACTAYLLTSLVGMSRAGFGFSSGLVDSWYGFTSSFFSGSLSNGLQVFSGFGFAQTSVILEGTQLSYASFFCLSLSLRLNLGFSSGASIFTQFSIFLPQGKGALSGSSSLKEKFGAYSFFGSSFFMSSLMGCSLSGSCFLTQTLLSAVGTQPSSFFSILFLRLNRLGTKIGCSSSGLGSALGGSSIGFLISSTCFLGSSGGLSAEISFLLGSLVLSFLSRMNLGPMEGFSSSFGYCGIFSSIGYATLCTSGLGSAVFSFVSWLRRFFLRLKGFFLSSSACCASRSLRFSSSLARSSSCFRFSSSCLRFSSCSFQMRSSSLSLSSAGSCFSFFFMKLGFMRLISSLAGGGGCGGECGSGFWRVAEAGSFLEEVPRMAGFSLLMFSYIEFLRGRSLA